jgi:hypothetical protein
MTKVSLEPLFHMGEEEELKISGEYMIKHL